MDTDLTVTQLALRDDVREFAQTTIKPQAS